MFLSGTSIGRDQDRALAERRTRPSDKRKPVPQQPDDGGRNQASGPLVDFEQLYLSSTGNRTSLLMGTPEHPLRRRVAVDYHRKMTSPVGCSR